ncbi:MAG: carboxylating nicotinate-nucleotide diphosphorylase [Pegethrix bostrychoides GSE-TBD4-15B]|jgi:nicotinate-nucleotide pyrophosphorylase (carboxylating)|uniref:Probable nicotinate-nucleotide pyrophosphorylase [carboxylating] n=1 Tax=Pegethrix bostrychoides GSE-TBD4-15B TaxID=2839662 RepID=A0A951PBH1_9CYAN|nr:carboxylating nicotinate-nucleotide diphosphorylase [Pegethrix bostrychoides GSE-TBD4-15B]
MITAVLPPRILLDRWLRDWLLEDIGRGDQTTAALFLDSPPVGQAQWVVKEAGVIAGLPVAALVFELLNPAVCFTAVVPEGSCCEPGQIVAKIQGSLDALLTGERLALNLAMRLSGIASLTRQYTAQIADLPAQLVDTRKTTPGLRSLEKYAVQVGGAANHRLGLDDGVMIKDNHIAAAGGITQAVQNIRACIPYPLTVEVETESLEQVNEALASGADIIMLDNMPAELMRQAVTQIRQTNSRIKIEASGNITLETIRAVAETGVDYISSSAPITRSTWLDLSMRMLK